MPTDEAEPTCVQECDCTPVVYVRADADLFGAAASPSSQRQLGTEPNKETN